MVRKIQLAVAILAIAALSLVVVGVAAWQGNEPPAKRTGPINGKVLLPDGKPAPKTRLTLIRQAANGPELLSEALADTMGSFEFAQPKWPEIGESELKLVVEVEGCGLTFRGLADWKNGDAVRALPATELHIALFQPMGKPVSGMRVWPYLLVIRGQDRPQFVMLPPSIAERYAAASQGGKFSIKGLPQGAEARLAHDSPYFAKFTYDQRIALSNAPVTEAPSQHLAIGASLSGKVTLGATGEPVVGVTVNAQEANDPTGRPGGNGWGNTLTDKDGNFTLGQLTAGKYNVNVMLTGKMEADWTSIAYDSAPLKEGEKKAGMDLKLIKGGLITGMVKFSDGKPVYPVGVGVYGPARPRSGAWVQFTMTDKEGLYSLRVPPGLNHAYLSGGPGLPDVGGIKMRGITVEDGKTSRLDFEVPR